jgi:hypothetical protein
METAMSESGAFVFRAIYENSSFKQRLDLSPLLESKAYVGKVVQLNIYSSVIFGAIASVFGTLLVWSLPEKKMWMHGFMRTPLFILEYFSITMESSLLSALHWWQWLIVHIVSTGAYFALFFALRASSGNTLLSNSIAYELYACINFVLYLCVLIFTPKYRSVYVLFI